MDYRKFLDKRERAVLPYLGGMFVHTRHLVGDWLFCSGTQAERLRLMPEEEPPRLSLGGSSRT